MFGLLPILSVRNSMRYLRSSNDASPESSLLDTFNMLIPGVALNPCKRVIALFERSTR